MSTRLKVELEELGLAWSRTKGDRPDRCFVNHPHLFRWIGLDADAWLGNLQAELAKGYVPKGCHLCQIPKPGHLLRPASLLDIKDEVVYNLLVGKMFPAIYEALSPFQGDPDVAYQLLDPKEGSEWVRSDFVVWKQWRQRSLGKLNAGYSYVVLSDITGFYDNIDIGRLLEDLRAICPDGAELRLLSECLHRWAGTRGKGVPQGHSASDILAKVYLNVVDRALVNAGHTHLRYVDDYRLLTHSKREAKQAIKGLSSLMHHRGLNLQTAKTRIISRDLATEEFDGVAAIINDVQRQLGAELLETTSFAEVSLSASEISRMLDEVVGESAPEVLERTFTEWFGVSGEAQFKKTLFHYLLTQLGKVGSTIAVDYCIDTIRSRPEETAHILQYFSAVELAEHQLDQMLTYAESQDAIYDYQLHQLVRWFYDSRTKDPRILALCRQSAFDGNREPCLRSFALAYLGEYGDSSDLESIENNYANVTAELEKADYVAAIARQERSRRNAFYGRIQGDGDLVKRAIQLAKQRSSPPREEVVTR